MDKKKNKAQIIEIGEFTVLTLIIILLILINLALSVFISKSSPSKQQTSLRYIDEKSSEIQPQDPNSKAALQALLKTKFNDQTFQDMLTSWANNANEPGGFWGMQATTNNVIPQFSQANSIKNIIIDFSNQAIAKHASEYGGNYQCYYFQASTPTKNIILIGAAVFTGKYGNSPPVHSASIQIPSSNPLTVYLFYMQENCLNVEGW